jgi:hypothetical protein
MGIPKSTKHSSRTKKEAEIVETANSHEETAENDLPEEPKSKKKKKKRHLSAMNKKSPIQSIDNTCTTSEENKKPKTNYRVSKKQS